MKLFTVTTIDIDNSNAREPDHQLVGIFSTRELALDHVLKMLVSQIPGATLEGFKIENSGFGEYGFNYDGMKPIENEDDEQEEDDLLIWSIDEFTLDQPK